MIEQQSFITRAPVHRVFNPSGRKAPPTQYQLPVKGKLRFFFFLMCHTYLHRTLPEWGGSEETSRLWRTVCGNILPREDGKTELQLWGTNPGHLRKVRDTCFFQPPKPDSTKMSKEVERCIFKTQKFRFSKHFFLSVCNIYGIDVYSLRTYYVCSRRSSIHQW